MRAKLGASALLAKSCCHPGKIKKVARVDSTARCAVFLMCGGGVESFLEKSMLPRVTLPRVAFFVSIVIATGWIHASEPATCPENRLCSPEIFKPADQPEHAHVASARLIEPSEIGVPTEIVYLSARATIRTAIQGA